MLSTRFVQYASSGVCWIAGIGVSASDNFRFQLPETNSPKIHTHLTLCDPVRSVAVRKQAGFELLPSISVIDISLFLFTTVRKIMNDLWEDMFKPVLPFGFSTIKIFTQMTHCMARPIKTSAFWYFVKLSFISGVDMKPAVIVHFWKFKKLKVTCFSFLCVFQWSTAPTQINTARLSVHDAQRCWNTIHTQKMRRGGRV